MKWWLPLWVVTSALLLVWAARVEYGIVAAGIYIGANAIAVAITGSRRPPVPPGFLTAVGWAAALQLPVVLVVYFDPVDMKRAIDEQTTDVATDEGGAPR